MTAPAEINSLGDVRPGDLMFTGMNSAPNRAIVYGGQLLIGELVRLGRFVVGHVAVVGPDGKTIIEAMPNGARERALRDSDWAAGHAFVRLPEDWPGQAADAAAIARLFVTERVGYSFSSYAYLAAYRFGWRTKKLEARIAEKRPYSGPAELPSGAIMSGDGRLPCRAICSGLADQSWTLAGHEVITGVRPMVVTPGKMAMQLWRRPGVIWGGPGLLG